MASVKNVRGEVREFLATRRAEITPDRAGLPSYGGKRRLTGLRRDEVLDGIARALQLDEVERAHLADLVRTANAARPTAGSPSSPTARHQARRRGRP